MRGFDWLLEGLMSRLMLVMLPGDLENQSTALSAFPRDNYSADCSWRVICRRRLIHSYEVYGKVTLSYGFPFVHGSASQEERVLIRPAAQLRSIDDFVLSMLFRGS
jgi:hypothetical protein